MTSPSPAEMALYVGLVLVAIWVAYRLYLSFLVTKKEEGFDNQDVNTFTMYYADWCGHCQTAKPEFAKLGSTQTIGGKVVNIKMVNPESQPDEAAGVNIRGFPTILLNTGGKVVEYSGQRTQSDFLSFLQSNVN